MEKKKSFLTILSNRAYLSMLGKGIIGLVGGLVLLFITISRSRENNKPKLYNDKTNWVENAIIEKATLPDSASRFKYFKIKGYGGKEIDSEIMFIYKRCKGGSLLKELKNNEVDSILSANKIILSSNLSDMNDWVFYVKSIDSADFLLVIKDSLIAETVEL